MPIIAECSCGKKFKVKDELAGKLIRCPNCEAALRIPGAGSEAGARKSAAPVVDEAAALRRYEEAQRRKQLSAEAEAVYRAEQNKIIESYDQLAGRTGKGEKKKGQLTETKPKKATVFTKIADVIGALFATLIVRYLVIFVLLAGGVTGSVLLVRYVTGYMKHETSPPASKEERVKELFREAETAVAAHRWTDASKALIELLRVDSTKKVNREYLRLRDEVDKNLAKPRR